MGSTKGAGSMKWTAVAFLSCEQTKWRKPKPWTPHLFFVNAEECMYKLRPRPMHIAFNFHLWSWYIWVDILKEHSKLRFDGIYIWRVSRRLLCWLRVFWAGACRNGETIGYFIDASHREIRCLCVHSKRGRDLWVVCHCVLRICPCIQ